MTALTIRPAYSMWPQYNRRLRDVVMGMDEAQLALRPAPDRWPVWATVGHVACQRVFWLCDFAGEPGIETTPFPNAGDNCPGDDDLDHPWDAASLVHALDSSFRIVEGCLDRWTLPMLAEEIRRHDFGPDWVHSRGSVIQKLFTHDAYHCGELSQTLGIAGLPQIELWEADPVG